jgi:hypothetical protein
MGGGALPTRPTVCPVSNFGHLADEPEPDPCHPDQAVKDVENLLARWIRAEATADAAALERLLDASFRGDDPAGHVLGKDEWLDRYRTGSLVPEAFAWRDADVRVHERTAVAMGIQTQQAGNGDQAWNGEFRATLVAVRLPARWSIVNLQLRRVG